MIVLLFSRIDVVLGIEEVNEIGAVGNRIYRINGIRLN